VTTSQSVLHAWNHTKTPMYLLLPFYPLRSTRNISSSLPLPGFPSNSTGSDHDLHHATPSLSKYHGGLVQDGDHAPFSSRCGNQSDTLPGNEYRFLVSGETSGPPADGCPGGLAAGDHLPRPTTSAEVLIPGFANIFLGTMNPWLCY